MSGAQPVWIAALARACERRSQATVAREIGYSPAVINQVLRGRYSGNIERVEKAVRGALLHETVDCPVLGELAGHRCLAHQTRPFATTNPLRVQLHRACRGGCPHSRLGETT